MVKPFRVTVTFPLSGCANGEPSARFHVMPSVEYSTLYEVTVALSTTRGHTKTACWLEVVGSVSTGAAGNPCGVAVIVFDRVPAAVVYA